MSFVGVKFNLLYNNMVCRYSYIGLLKVVAYLAFIIEFFCFYFIYFHFEYVYTG